MEWWRFVPGEGVSSQGATVDSRRYLRHMRLDKATGRFVAAEKKVRNRVTVGYELDVENYEALSVTPWT